jgi:hypothetical protein
MLHFTKGVNVSAHNEQFNEQKGEKEEIRDAREEY